MDKETYEKQKAFAGEKKPSMLRRMVGHDYTERQMYMITMVTEGRQPLLGTLVGNADAPDGRRFVCNVHMFTRSHVHTSASDQAQL